MPEVVSATLLNVTSTTGTPTAKWSFSGKNSGTFYQVDVRNTSALSVYGIVASGTLTFNIQVTSDPSGAAGWANAAVRAPGGGAYATTAQTPTSSGASYFLDPADNICWVRLNVATNSAVSPLVQLIAEV